MYILKQIIIEVHANPKNHPGGVQGAFNSPSYQSEGTPFPVKKPPIARAEKFIKRNIIILKVIVLILILNNRQNIKVIVINTRLYLLQNLARCPLDNLIA